MSQTILIIEDDSDIADLIEVHVTDLGYGLDRATDGESGLAMALQNDYALIILDLMLPRLGGMEVCRRLREKDSATPILMLTAKSEEFDKVLGLEIGADDYLTKPFSIREMIARVKAILRRVETRSASALASADVEQLEFGDLLVFPSRRKVTLRGDSVELTAKEFDLLHLFASHPGRAYTRQELLNIIWGYQFEGYEHTVNSHINRLRAKIEHNPSEPVYIQTVWGVGYRFTEAEEL